ncbi:Alpha/beta hydrolase domain-containing protein 17C [Babesia sp. Xinjiang]|uniref:Alpha/beta hydrolase domain-containing protein 17C n=1 Tax=Babesia sp. Xinjiang TaxID=462227 RepID=UPI000A21A225|nr:Alpha/beta hydrolase domain-containing protein 17C [Babesia sp. Xinjiang]ORM41884.1 Alpha/beta hydrolase domain-containing protein 17C [Babesia sp. Xinjiang]
MGQSLSVVNSFIFPAPPPSYTSQLYELIWIPKRFGYDPDGSRKATPGSFPVLYLPSPVPSNVVLIYLHGNSCDIGQVKPELRLISHEINASVIAVEYPGYGVSPEVTVANGELINCRVRATFNFLTSLGVDQKSIVFFGRSIGTGPAAALAAEFKKRGIQCGGVILQSPYISIHRIIEEYFALGTWLVSNFWDTEKALNEMGPTTPLLIIHGLADEIVPVYHGQALYESYQSELKMADFQPNSKHNMYSIIDDLCLPISKFLNNLSLSKDMPPVNLKLPQWCLYSCHKLVSGQTIMERSRNTGFKQTHMKQVMSARGDDRSARRVFSRNYSMNDGAYVVCKNPDSARRSTPATESPRDMKPQPSVVTDDCASKGSQREVKRTVSKTSFQSSLHELCENNVITTDDISVIVNDAIERASNL